MEKVALAYYAQEAAKRPAVSRGQALLALVKSADSGEHRGAFPADPLVALQCLNQDRSKTAKVGPEGREGRSWPGSGVCACHAGLADASCSGRFLSPGLPCRVLQLAMGCCHTCRPAHLSCNPGVRPRGLRERHEQPGRAR